MSSIKQHQEMGYDRSASMFSPSGLLLQVEYAEKAVKLGTSVLAMKTKEGLVFIADRKIKSKLIVKESFKKVFEIDNHIYVAGSGVMSDGRRLIEQAQVTAQEHKAKFQNPIDLISLVKDIANIKQYYSQSGGLRPFGVALLIGGVENNKPKLYKTTPSGFYIEIIANSVGNLQTQINEELEKSYKENTTNQKAITYGLNLFKKVQEEKFEIENFDVVSIDLENKQTRLEEKEIKKLI